jgi:hypothetical protein
METDTQFSGTTLGPAALKVITKAFDDAWAEIGSCFAREGLQAESARSRLAAAILSVARENSSDSDAVKDAALRLFAAEHRAR